MITQSICRCISCFPSWFVKCVLRSSSPLCYILILSLLCYFMPMLLIWNGEIVFVAQLPAGPLCSGQRANPSPGAAAGGVPGPRGAAGHAHRLGPRLHRWPVRHTAGRPRGTQGDTPTIRRQHSNVSWVKHRERCQSETFCAFFPSPEFAAVVL